MRTPSPTKVISGVVNTTPIIVSSNAPNGFSVRKVATGQYMLQFSPDFRLIGIVAIGMTGGAVMAIMANAIASNSVLLNIYAVASSALADVPFQFTATGM